MNPNPEPLTPVNKDTLKAAMTVVCQDELDVWVDLFNEEHGDEEGEIPITEDSLKEFIKVRWNELPRTDRTSYHNDWIYQQTADLFCDHFEIQRAVLENL
jgi:hypothetical protein